MGRKAGRIAAAAAAAALLVAGAATAVAGAGSAKVRAPKIEHISASVASNRASVAATIDAENLESSYQLALVYRPTDCCLPETKQCCTPEVEVFLTGKLPPSSTTHEVHGSVKLREGSYSVRVRVEADNSAGDSEKSRALHLPRH
jgi:hypothetical protein